MNSGNKICPICTHPGLVEIYAQVSVPVHSVVLVREHHRAANFPTGDIQLVCCEYCGFAFNSTFNPVQMKYSEDYEETQSYSPTFSHHQESLARILVDRFDLKQRRIVEVGCGKGEFLSLLCNIGANHGIGFDPGFDPLRITLPENVSVKQTLFDRDQQLDNIDFIACVMTLEHISQPVAFLQDLRHAIGVQNPVVFFQVPDAQRIYQHGAFWDIYHEHCNYFTDVALSCAFERAGFAVQEVSRTFSDQYLTIVAKPDKSIATTTSINSKFSVKFAGFPARVSQHKQVMMEAILENHSHGGRLALWGGGSKAVALLTVLDIDGQQCRVVDINTHKHNSYLPGSGHRVYSPESLQQYAPTLVIIMNGAYEKEIIQQLDSFDLQPKLIILP
ncbi:MAG: hypothetical protein ACI8P9_004858 [Parasphingorhabdus sp.]|jgi:hypothetical protein